MRSPTPATIAALTARVPTNLMFASDANEWHARMAAEAAHVAAIKADAREAGEQLKARLVAEKLANLEGLALQFTSTLASLRGML